MRNLLLKLRSRVFCTPENRIVRPSALSISFSHQHPIFRRCIINPRHQDEFASIKILILPRSSISRASDDELEFSANIFRKRIYMCINGKTFHFQRDPILLPVFCASHFECGCNNSLVVRENRRERRGRERDRKNAKSERDSIASDFRALNPTENRSRCPEILRYGSDQAKLKPVNDEKKKFKLTWMISFRKVWIPQGIISIVEF